MLALLALSHCALPKDGATFSGLCGHLVKRRVAVDPGMGLDKTPRLTLSAQTGVHGGSWLIGRRPWVVWAGFSSDPDVPKAPIQLEIYGGNTGILRTIYGWFPVSDYRAGGSMVQFSLDGSREVPPNALDAQIIRRAAAILSSVSVWNRADNRVCPKTEPLYSIYCAVETATVQLSGGPAHRRPAMEVIRNVVDDRTKALAYNHRLMDYNNDPRTTFADVRSLFQEALRNMRDRVWLRRHGFAI